MRTAKAGTGADVKLARYDALHFAAIDRNLSGVQPPEPGEVLFAVSQQDFNAYTLIRWLIGDAVCDDLFVTTFNVNSDILRAFAGLLDDGRVGRFSLVLSQSIESRMPERVEDLRALWTARADRFRVALCWNHSKVSCLALADGRRYVVTGSGNFSFNAETEQYEVWAGEEPYAWWRSVLEKRAFPEGGPPPPSARARAGKSSRAHKVWGAD